MHHSGTNRRWLGLGVASRILLWCPDLFGMGEALGNGVAGCGVGFCRERMQWALVTRQRLQSRHVMGHSALVMGRRYSWDKARLRRHARHLGLVGNDRQADIGHVARGSCAVQLSLGTVPRNPCKIGAGWVRPAMPHAFLNSCWAQVTRGLPPTAHTVMAGPTMSLHSAKVPR